jgi:hypothetical protein
MHRTTIDVDEQQMRTLRALAATRGGSVSTVVRDAVDEYVKRHRDHDEAVAQLQALVERIRARVPDSVRHEEIEDDITRARAETRAARDDARRR